MTAAGSIVERFEAQRARAPQAIAIERGDERLSYAALDARADRLAAALVRRGVGREAIVALVMPRSIDQVIACLGVWKAGAAWLPIDPAYPRARIEAMLEDARPVLVLDTVVDGEGDAPPRAAIDPSALAYVIYTSGSTGRPKGVAIEHRGLPALADAQAEVLGVGPGDRVLQLASPSFDASVAELVMALAHGGTLCLAPEEARAGAPLHAFLARREISAAIVPPSVLATLPALPLPALRILNVAGEPCPARLVDAWAKGRAFFNHYGPTEATVWSTVARCEAGRAPTIGRAIPGAIARVLVEREGALRPVEGGGEGELYLGGPGVARGYLGRDEETAARFVRDPLGAGRLFRSGDRVRLRDDGELEFLGRVDRQLKVRGVRVEPEEIELALAAHGGVEAAAVIARGDALAAYFAGAATAAELRAHLAARLPAALVPSTITRLEALPRTPAGKIDVAALPATLERGLPTGAPADAREAVLARLFAEVLALDEVGPDEDFFALGGHSLRAARLLVRVREELGVDLPLGALRDAATVRALAAIARGAVVEAPPVPAGDRPRVLSSGQRRLWLAEQREPGLAVYNAAALLRLSGTGAGDRDAIVRALSALSLRHEPLRMRFTDEGDGEPRVIVDERSPEAEVIDLRAQPPAQRQAELRRLADAAARRPFDVAGGPLMRAAVVLLDRDESAIIWVAHHLVTDGWSLAVLERELAALVDAFAAGRPSPLAPLAVDWPAFAAWERARLDGARGDRLLAYWQERLEGLPALSLPTDRAPSVMRRRPGARLPIAIDAGTTRALETLARQERATPFQVLLAAFQVVLGRFAGQEDVAVGAPAAGRDRPGLDGIIGFVAETVVLRGDLAGAPRFRELVGRTRAKTLQDLAHGALPLDRLTAALSDDRVRQAPLFRAMLVHEVALPRVRVGGLTVDAEPLANGTAMFDLLLAITQRDDRLDGLLTWDTDLLDEPTAHSLADAFASLLRAAVHAPDTPIAALPILSARERERVNAALAPAPRAFEPALVHELVAAQAALTPEAPAVTRGDETLSYRALDRRANALAHALVAAGARGGVVAVPADPAPTVDTMVAILAALKAGAAYVPIDPRWPEARRRQILNETRAIALPPASRDEAETPPEVAIAADALAYVLYTSGSTGQPKGVCMPHAAVANLIAWHLAELPRGRRTLQLQPLTFDVSFQELFSTWATGGLLLLGDAGLRQDPSLLGAAIEASRVERLFVPVVVLQQLAERWWDQPRALASLREVMASGEQLRVTKDVRRLFAALPGCALHNHYGPTETHVVTTHVLDGDPLTWPARPPIGRPIANVRAQLVDRDGALVPGGVVGELQLSGPSLARDYLARPELTRARFVERDGARWYATGDLARLRSDDTLEYLGRNDGQLKVRGFRVEPGEIEALLAEHAQVQTAVVGLRDDALVAWIVAGDPPPEDGALLRHLASKLPEHMLPSAFVLVEALPLTAHGKLDRDALPSPDRRGAARHADYRAPASDAEKRIADIWMQLLRLPRVGADDDFFDIGGHSLSAMQVAVRVSRAFGVQLRTRAVFERRTVARLAAHVEELIVEELLGEEGSG